MPKNNSGFSLLELSIVLVIIGLIIAGVMGGNHLLQAAKLNKVIAEIKGYAEAIYNFKEKYHAWPGDMPNATSYWGTYNAGTNPKGTVNGNGNELIEGNATERIRAWQQLSLADMITGYYTGVDAGTPDHEIGVNVPGSVLEGKHYFLHTATTPHFGTTGQSLQLGSTKTNDLPWDAALTPADAYTIDKKIDDGKPDSGQVYFFRGDEYLADTTKCVNPNKDQASGTAILTDNTVSCRVWFWLQKD